MLKKILYVIMALLFGSFGIHNFVEHNAKSGLCKLILTMCGCFLFGYSNIIFESIQTLVGIWILVDIIWYCVKNQPLYFTDIIKFFKKE